MRKALLFLLLTAGLLHAAEEYTFWIEPCTPALTKETACTPTDPELARWALEAWQRESKSTVTFKQIPNIADARIRIHWAGGASGLYGETQYVNVNNKRGANVFVLPDIRELGPDIASAGTKDPLLREAIVYLTCVHELGHAIGLDHTRNFADIMFSFGYGGDIVEYFQRYRRILSTRSDIPTHSGISATDLDALHHL